jgi:chemotaxis protein methyltransferase CheR
MSLPSPRLEETRLLSPPEFAHVAEIARRVAGLALSPAKNSMISARIARRLRATGQPDFASYVAFLDSRAGHDELRMLISALTTNVSHFFREDHHFRLLDDLLQSRLIAETRAGRRVRIWSAGCATGQEPYSIAITVLRRFPDAASHDLRILATDIDEAALARAVAGRFTPRQLDGVPAGELHRHFREVSGEEMEVGADLRAMIRFRPLNLIADWPFRGAFDVIFCRNVVIYFDAATQAALWPRFHRALAQDGVLFIGHSERLDPSAAKGFVSIGVTSYRKGSADEAQRGDRPAWH